MRLPVVCLQAGYTTCFSLRHSCLMHIFSDCFKFRTVLVLRARGGTTIHSNERTHRAPRVRHSYFCTDVRCRRRRRRSRRGRRQ